MLVVPSVLAVLASLLNFHPPSGSAEVLDPSCGRTRSGQSPHTVGPWTALLHVNGRIVCAGTLIHSSGYLAKIFETDLSDKRFVFQGLS